MSFPIKKVRLILGLGIVILTSCSTSKEKKFEKEAAEQNRLYPMMIDSYTRIDSIRYTATENTFQYFYTLLGDFDNKDIALQKQKELKEELPTEIKNTPGMTIHREYKVIMEYIYFSNNSGDELFRITITPDMYQ